jgi:hypothetical protein
MAKQQYLKFQVALTVGNRKSQLVLPVEIDEDTNTHVNELNILIQNFVDAVKALPTTDVKYDNLAITNAICNYFQLQAIPVVA